MLTRILVTILVISALCLPLLTACNGEATPPPEPAPTTPAPAPEPMPEPEPEPEPAPTEQEQLKILLAEAVLAMHNVQSYKVSIEMDMATEITGGENPVKADITMKADSEFDMADKELHMSMEMDGGQAAQAVQDVTMDMYLVSGWMYMKMNVPMLGEQWMKMPISEELMESYDLNMVEKHFALLNSPAEIELTGMETVDGAPCYALRVTPDMQALLQWAQQQGAGGPATDWEKAGHLAESFESLSFLVWISEDSKLVKKMDLDMLMVTTGEQVAPESPSFDTMTMDIKMSMRMYDYNEPISIALPAEAENAREMPGMATQGQ